MAAPTPAELGPLLGETNDLDAEPVDTEDDDAGGAYMASARAAVGSDLKAAALKDAITECLREHGLIGDTEVETTEEDPELDSDLGEGFGDI
jgi:hypothetical protein